MLKAGHCHEQGESGGVAATQSPTCALVSFMWGRYVGQALPPPAAALEEEQVHLQAQMPCPSSVLCGRPTAALGTLEGTN